MPDVVEVVHVVAAVVEVPATLTQVVEVPAVVGPRGPAGDGAAIVWQQTTPLASWSIPHTLGRRPCVALYVGGELIFTDVTATATSVTVAWSGPTVGEAVLN